MTCPVPHTLSCSRTATGSVVRYRVAQQMKEIAIRLALGAPGWRVTAAVLSDTIACVGVGLVGGLVLALAAASAIRSYLFGIEPRDGVTLVASSALVVTAALLARVSAGTSRAARRSHRCSSGRLTPADVGSKSRADMARRHRAQ